MVIVSPLSMAMFPFQMAFLWVFKKGLRTILTSPDMILQVGLNLCNYTATSGCYEGVEGVTVYKPHGCIERLNEPLKNGGKLRSFSETLFLREGNLNMM